MFRQFSCLLFTSCLLALLSLLSLGGPSLAETSRPLYGASPVSPAVTLRSGRVNIVDYSTVDHGTFDIKPQPGYASGTITPRGVNAAAIQGVNTAGTVRVNNLANLEALLNIIANGAELIGVVWGSYLLLTGGKVLLLAPVVIPAAERANFLDAEQSVWDANADREKNVAKAYRRVFVGVSVIIIGLMTPGVINWLVASARDSSLCM